MRLVFRAALAANAALALHAAPAAACTVDWRMVFFAHGSAELDNRARAILDNGVAAARAMGSKAGRLKVSGHADRSGSENYNWSLSRRRAEAVRDYFASRGLRAATIDIAPFGEHRLLVETPDGATEPQNRFVVVEEVVTPQESARRAAERKASGDTTVC
jgi:outer membrane protein OmpA-like peptidoglycan-associated protein